jgi:hypothetical protein
MQSFDNIGIEILLEHPDDFLKVRETLTRIGIASRKEKNLYQSCHILHKQGRYKIVHFKELFYLDRRPTNISEEDIARRNVIAKLLADWNLVKLVRPEECESPTGPIDFLKIRIIPFKQKDNWQLIPKYDIGRKKEDFTSEEVN